MLQTVETERAWAAGFFDGEGHVAPRKVHMKSKNPDLQLALYSYMDVAQTKDGEKMLTRFGRAVGGFGKIMGYKSLSGKIAYHWRITDLGELQTIAGVLWPYLCDTKKAQFKHTITAITENALKRTAISGKRGHMGNKINALKTKNHIDFSKGVPA